MEPSPCDGGGADRRAETLRRTNLYGILSRKRLPTVHVQPHDARTRKELLLWTPAPLTASHDGLAVYEHELEQRKHHEHLGMRPALDQSTLLQDLYTTVPKQIHDLTAGMAAAKLHGREWRVGYKNHPQSDWHGVGLNGIFEPSDSLREQLIHSERYQDSSTAFAYPMPFVGPEQAQERLEPVDEDKARRDAEERLRAGMLGGARSKCSNQVEDGESAASTRKTKQPHWCPASSSTLGVSSSAKSRPALVPVEQGCALRVVASPLQKLPLAADERCIQKEQAKLERASEIYEHVLARTEHHKDPAMRYSLPIENPKWSRSYRLGLDPVPSTPGQEHPENNPADTDRQKIASPKLSDAKQGIKKTKQPQSKAGPPLLFRPKSAVSLRMDTAASPTLARSSSSVSILTRKDANSAVAGAKRRPHSASLSYLSNSTVYCMEPPQAQQRTCSGSSPDATQPTLQAHELIKQQQKYGTDFLAVLMKERARRRERQPEVLQNLARRGFLHTIPIPQVFARLRREALKNFTRRAQYAQYEKMPLEEYMALCGMAVLPPSSTHDELQAGPDELNDPDDASQGREGRVGDAAPPSPTSARDPATDRDHDDDDQDPIIRALQDQVELRKLQHDESGATTGGFRKRRTIRPDPVNGNNSSTVLAMRRALVVTREQLHIALEAFALPALEVNQLFSALDLDVADQIAVWEVICTVERLQDGHEELRRSRVHVKARNLPRDLDALRKSVAIPHRTHVALPLDSFMF